VQGVRFHSLQQGPAATHSDLASFDLEPTWQHTAAIENAAAAMLDLDLVITVDGMAAHLAGSLGRPVWLLLKQDADWRWMDARSDSPWYPGMTLWRQAPETGWPELLARVAAALHDWRGARMR